MIISERAIRKIVSEELGNFYGSPAQSRLLRPELVLEKSEIRALRIAGDSMKLLREAEDVKKDGGEILDKAMEYLSSPVGKKIVTALLKVIKFFAGKAANVHDLLFGYAASNVEKAIKWIGGKFGFVAPVEGLKGVIKSIAQEINPGDWAKSGIDEMISWVNETPPVEYEETVKRGGRAGRTKKSAPKKSEKTAGERSPASGEEKPVATGTRKNKLEAFRDILGTMKDADVAKRAGVRVDTVQKYRKKLGIPAFKKSSEVEASKVVSGDAAEAPEVPKDMRGAISEALFLDVKRFEVEEIDTFRLAVLRALAN